MNRWITTLFAVLIWSGPGLLVGFTQIQSKVVDAHSGEPVIHAHVYWKSQIRQGKGTATDLEGAFRLPDPTQLPDTLIIHALGYRRLGIALSRTPIALPDRIQLEPGVYQMKEAVLVQARQGSFESEQQDQMQKAASERLQSQYAGASLIKRGPHAAELSIRGLSSERLTTRINDVPVYSACVDKMDPATSYVNPTQIGSLQRNGDQLGTPDEINVQLKPVDQQRGWKARVKADYLTANRQPKMNASLGFGAYDWSWESNGYWMQAGDLVAGGGKVVENSQQHQLNFGSTFRYQKRRSDVELHGSYNNSWEVGYPALLMDATRALSYIGSVAYRYQPRWQGVHGIQTKLYYSRVEHTMDDYSRDVSQREVMRNMYMPMQGHTETFGVQQQWRGSGNAHSWSAKAEWYQMTAFGDMRMESIFDGVPDMYLLNLGDIRQQTVDLDLKWNQQFDGGGLLTWKGGVIGHDRALQATSSKRYFQTLYGSGAAQHFRLGWHTALEWEQHPTQTLTWGGSLSMRSRIPNHKELFGYYIYNYEDGFFYTGNPDLVPEQHLTIDGQFAVDRSDFTLQMIPFVNYIRHWVAGVFDEGFVGQNGVYQFKQYQNTGDALLMGLDTRVQWKPLSHWEVGGRIQYTYGQHLTWKEPLRMIAPLHGALSVGYYRDAWNLVADWSAAMAQDRIARRHSVEDRTPGYQVINLAGSWQVAPSLQASLSVQNLLDSYYWTHNSIGNVPSLGRTVQVSVQWTLP
jgi:iron complex outermembrane receptor protein